MPCYRSIGRLLGEDSTTFKSVLCLDKGVSHPVVPHFLGIAEGSLANPWRGSIPKSSWWAETGPLIETQWPVLKVCGGSWSSSKHKQSSEGSRTQSKTNCAESTLCGEKVRLVEKMSIGLTDDFICCVIVSTYCFKAWVVPLVDAPESVSWHYFLLIIRKSLKWWTVSSPFAPSDILGSLSCSDCASKEPTAASGKTRQPKRSMRPKLRTEQQKWAMPSLPKNSLHSLYEKSPNLEEYHAQSCRACEDF